MMIAGVFAFASCKKETAETGASVDTVTTTIVEETVVTVDSSSADSATKDAHKAH